MKKFSSVIFAFVFILALLTGNLTTAKAAESDYTYQLTFSAGSQGSFSSNAADKISVVGCTDYQISVTETKLTVSGLSIGSVVTLPSSVISVEDGSRYYAKGFRISGQDNTSIRATAVVDSDEDYVMTYGITADQVAYTVYFQDDNGNELAPSETYYGNIGDMPVVAYHYFENFVPQAYNLTKTLLEDETQNVFTFIYHTGTGLEQGQVTDDGNTNENAGTTDENGDAGNQEGNVQLTDEDEDQPEEIVNLDDNTVPLADQSDDSSSLDSSNPSILADAIAPFGIKIASGVGIAVISLGLIVYIVLTLVKKKKKESGLK